MPAERFTKKATTPKSKRQWDHVYSDAKQRGDPPSVAIRKANAAVKKAKK
jgi:hypothetical protein